MFRYFYTFISVFLLLSCSQKEQKPEKRNLSQEFKNYWFSGKAEITSYHLEQARYGEIRKGEAVLIYVSEDFLPREQVKANYQQEENISVLKLNATKKFLTGIYPYSIMQSCFYPIAETGHAIKVSASIQEWCGQTYMQLNNRKKFEIESHSYFEGEADQNLSLDETHLENEIWTLARIENEHLPTGEFWMIPSFEYLRLSHQPIKAYQATGEYFTEHNYNIYTLEFPELKRKLKLHITRTFPYVIEKWEESYPSGRNAEILTTTATKKSDLRIDYWNKNSNKDLPLRKNLQLN